MRINGRQSLGSGSLGANRRGNDRAVLKCRVKVKPRDRLAFESDIEDISTTGFRVSCPADLQPGSAIFVTIPGMEMLSATVRWKAGFHYGCSFERSLYPAVFEHIVKKLNNT